ncbi:MAG: restriction endonuclease subunit S [Burkholderiaceae bacterium]|nr:restriction endonuclease subunit S [Burkholderiaceae bacterium]
MTGLIGKSMALVSDAPNGITRIRGLILQLAVEGRLLPGKEYGRTDRWRRLALPDVAAYRIGKTPPSKESRHWDAGGIPWVSISDMEHFNVLSDTSRKVSHECVGETFKYPPVPAGSLLMSFKLTVGKVCILGVDAYHNEAIISLQPKAGVSSDYLMRVLPAIAQQGKTKDALMGATLNSSTLAQLTVPLPPLDEQRVIVAKVDELMALCDRLEARQQDAEAAHAQLVQALLDSLTQARDPDEFRASWQTLAGQFHALFTTEASVGGLRQAVIDCATSGRLPELGGDGELPQGWCRGSLGDLVADSGSGWSPSCDPRPRSGDEWGVLKVSAVSWGRFRPDENKALPAHLVARPEFEVKLGDFLISRANTAGLVARSVLVEAAPPKLMLSDKIVRLRFANTCDPRYVQLANSSTAARSYYAAVAGGTSSSMKNVTRSQILALPILCPPLAEQQRIVAKVTELLTLCDQLKALIAAARAKHAQLADALVAQAIAA